MPTIKAALIDEQGTEIEQVDVTYTVTQSSPLRSWNGHFNSSKIGLMPGAYRLRVGEKGTVDIVVTKTSVPNGRAIFTGTGPAP
jgi:hypothetical protein